MSNMIIATIYMLVISLIIFGFYLTLNKHKRLEPEHTLHLPKGLFRVIILITTLSVLIFLVLSNNLDVLAELKYLILAVVTFYFGTRIAETFNN